MGQIRSATILTERQVNLRGTFKTDLCSSQALRHTDRADGGLCQDMWASDLENIYITNGGRRGSAVALCLNVEVTQIGLTNKMCINPLKHFTGKEF